MKVAVDIFGVLFIIMVITPLALARWNAYCLRCAMGIDLWLSMVTNGRPGETLSGRCGTAYLQGTMRGRIWCPIINAIMGSPTHCVGAIRGDIIRAHDVLADDKPYQYGPVAPSDG